MTWIFESPFPDDDEVSDVDLDSEKMATLPLVPSSRVGRFLAALSLLLCIFPGIGLIVSGGSILVNFGSRDWTRSVSLLSLFIALVVSVLMILLTSVLPRY